jgi:hypothetical protein
MTKNSQVIEKLKERHKIYLNLSDEAILKDPNWIINNPLKGKDLDEWVEFGVNTLISEFGFDKTKAEVEMSWLQSSYTISR